ncbi:MAG: SMC-Scp complex subunit ScpB, partial [Candidatus Omnitrophota bacterium]
MEENNLKSAVEALIFASEKPITTEQIKKVLGNLDASQVNEIITELKNEYETQHRGIRIAEIAGGFVMITNSDF